MLLSYIHDSPNVHERLLNVIPPRSLQSREAELQEIMERLDQPYKDFTWRTTAWHLEDYEAAEDSCWESILDTLWKGYLQLGAGGPMEELIICATSGPMLTR